MDIAAGLGNLAGSILRLFAMFGSFAMLILFGYKALAIVVSGASERTIKKEGLSMIGMAVAFAFLTSLAGPVATEWLPGPARTLILLGQLIWNALASAFQASVG